MEEFLKTYVVGSVKLLSSLREIQKAQLFSILETAINSAPVVDYKISVDHYIQSHPGVSGDKTIPTFHCECGDGIRRKAVIFVKQTWNRHEPGNFHLFARLGLPVPRLYGSIPGRGGGTILFMEYLPRSPGIFNLRGTAAAIDLLARVNAATSRIEDLSRVASGPRHDYDQWTSTVREICRLAEVGRFGGKMQTITGNLRADQLQRFLEQVRSHTEGAQAALNLQGYYDMRRSVRNELTMIDLADCRITFRFQNIAGLIQVLKRLSKKNVNYVDFFWSLFYLWRYHAHGGGWVKLSEFRREVRWEAYANMADDLCSRLNDPSPDSQGPGKHENDIMGKMRESLESLLDGLAEENTTA